MTEEEKQQQVEKQTEAQIEQEESREGENSVEGARQRLEQAAKNIRTKSTGEGQSSQTSTDTGGQEAEQATPDEAETEQGSTQTDDTTQEADASDEETTSQKIDRIASDYGLSLGEANAIRRHKNPEQVIETIEKVNDPDFVKKQVGVLKELYDDISAKQGWLGQQKSQQSKNQQGQAQQAQGPPTPDAEYQQNQQPDGGQGQPNQQIDPNNPFADIDARDDLPEDVKQQWRQDRQRYLQTVQQTQQQQQKEIVQTIDEWKQEMAQKSSAFADYFGEGSVTEMDPNSEPGQKMKKILNDANRMHLADPSADKKECLYNAFQMNESGLATRMTVDQVRQAANRQKKKTIGSGNKPTKKEPTGLDRAKEIAEQARQKTVQT